MIRKLIAAAVLVGSVALLAPSTAFAGQQAINVTLPAGNRVCIDDPSLAYNSARADGYASPGVKFTFLVKPLGSSSFVQLSESGIVTNWAAEANRYWYPWAFPGNFRACARNFGPGPSSVYLALNTY